MLGQECRSNPPTLDPNSGSGHVENLAGFDAYVTGSSDSKLAVLLVSDVFGYEAPNLRKLADKIAANGQFFVVVPDFFSGDPLDPKDRNNPKVVQDWIKKHNKEKGYEDAKVMISNLKSKGVSTVGVAGFCWGGNVVIKLASTTYIQAAVVLHPGPLTKEEIIEIRVPIAILGAEFDEITPQEQVKHAGEILSAKSEVDSFVKIFPGTTHGWTVRYSHEDESAVKSAEEAHLDMLNWLTKYVK